MLITENNEIEILSPHYEKAQRDINRHFDIDNWKYSVQNISYGAFSMCEVQFYDRIHACIYVIEKYYLTCVPLAILSLV